MWITKLLPTHGLFARVFLWFWLATIILMFGSAWVAKQVINNAELKPVSADVVARFEALAMTIEQHLNAAVTNDAQMTAELRKIARAKAMPMMLIAKLPPNEVHAMPPPLKPADKLIGAVMDEPRARLIQTVRADFIGPHAVQVNGRDYALFVGDPKPFSWLFNVNQRFPFYLPLITFTLSGFLCFLLVWSLLRPIKRLQSATRKMAAGELQTSLSTNSLGVDEIGQLGRDFNKMSEQVRYQMASQRRLLADISHELKTPLARQQVAIGLALKKVECKDIQGVEQSIERIDIENQRLNKMIRQLLQLSRLETLPEVKFVSTDLTVLVEGIVADAKFEAESQNKQITSKMDADVSIAGDAELLASAIENVLRNAIKYAASSVSVEMVIKGQQIVITVVDDGPGVEADKLQELFKPFVRLSFARERNSGGVGLGLAIAKQAISLHQGDISAQKAENAGLQVCISLPLERQAAAISF